jgi:Amt family ammonium transporter
LHGLCGTWGGIAAGIFGSAAFGGLGGVNVSWRNSLAPHWAIGWALVGGFVVYGILKIIDRLAPQPRRRV